jgi:hypothetical protein
LWMQHGKILPIDKHQTVQLESTCLGDRILNILIFSYIQGLLDFFTPTCRSTGSSPISKTCCLFTLEGTNILHGLPWIGQNCCSTWSQRHCST